MIRVDRATVTMECCDQRTRPSARDFVGDKPMRNRSRGAKDWGVVAQFFSEAEARQYFNSIKRVMSLFAGWLKPLKSVAALPRTIARLLTISRDQLSRSEAVTVAVI